jgi:hypothetical protein
MNKSAVSSFADAEAEKNGKPLLEYNVIQDYCSGGIEDSDISPIDDSFST